MENWGEYGVAGILAAVLFVLAQLGLAWAKARKENGTGKGELDDGKTRDQCLRDIYRMVRLIRDWHDPGRVGSLKQVGDALLPMLERIRVEIKVTEASRALIIESFQRTRERVDKLLDTYERENRRQKD